MSSKRKPRYVIVSDPDFKLPIEHVSRIARFFRGEDEVLFLPPELRVYQWVDGKWERLFW